MGWSKKSIPYKWRKNTQKNEGDPAESWKLGTCETRLWWFFLHKNIYLFLIYLADMAIWISNIDNFDIDQMSSKFAQRDSTWSVTSIAKEYPT